MPEKTSVPLWFETNGSGLCDKPEREIIMKASWGDHEFATYSRLMHKAMVNALCGGRGAR